MPKKLDANCFVISVSVGCEAEPRVDLRRHAEPATSVFSDGTLAMKTAAAWLVAPSKATVVKTIGTRLGAAGVDQLPRGRDDGVEVGAERRRRDR